MGMTDTARSSIRGAALALAAFAVFAAGDAIVKHLGASYATFQILFFSVLFSFPLVLLMLIGERERATLRPVHPRWSLFRALAVVIAGNSAFYAFATIPLTQVYAILFSVPLIITVLSIPVLGEKVGPHRWAAVVVGLIGVMIVVRPGAEAIVLGHIAALVAALTSAFASIVVRKIGRDERSAVLMLYPLLAQFIAMGALMPAVYRPLPLVDLGFNALFALLFFTAGLLLIAAYRAAAAAVVAPMQYSQILWAAFYGWLFFGESSDRFTWIGAGVVIASGLYIVGRESFGGRSNETPVLRSKSRPESGASPRTTPLEKLGQTPDESP